MAPIRVPLAALTLVVATSAQQLTYPEGAPIPRNLTAAESAYLRRNPPTPPEAANSPPTGPLHCAAEYEPMDGIILAWEGATGWKQILGQMATALTTVGQARAYLLVDSPLEQAEVTNALAIAGADMTRVDILVTPTDTIWVRDYGPRYVFEGDCRVVVDHTYNSPRPNDDRLTSVFGTWKRHTFYEHQLVHGGGNFHLDAAGRSYATRLINRENPTLTEAQIHGVFRDYQGVDTTFFDPFPRSVDLTQHLDMWMQVVGDDLVVISDWPADVGSTQDRICDRAAALMAARGYTVHRVPARALAGVHYTYTNVVMCNDLLLLPSYSQGQIAPHNAQARSVWAAALPNKIIREVDCQAIVQYAGVMHCIAMHVPAHRGGADPTAYLRNLNGGETLMPRSTVDVMWNVDDDRAVQSCDLLLSVNGGRSFPFVVARGLPPTGHFDWTVPDLAAPTARLRVVVHDAAGNTGHDDGDGDFAIRGQGCRAVAATYGTGKPGSRGVPGLTASAPPSLGTVVSLRLTNARPRSSAVALFGASPANVPHAGGTLLVVPELVLSFAVGATGAGSWPLLIPDRGSWCGGSLFTQVWILGDPGADGGTAASAGLRLQIGI